MPAFFRVRDVYVARNISSRLYMRNVIDRENYVAGKRSSGGELYTSDGVPRRGLLWRLGPKTGGVRKEKLP